MQEKIFSATELRKKMGKPDATFPEIRNYLKSKGIDQHSRLAMKSFDAILVSSDGTIYGYRRVWEQKDSKKAYSMFGGTVIEEKVTPKLVADVIMAKTPITGINVEQITMNEDESFSGAFNYKNGDKTFFYRSGAIVKLNDEQVKQLLEGENFNPQIMEVVQLTEKTKNDLYDYQIKIYEKLIQMLK